MKKSISRRQFVQGMAYAGGALTLLPNAFGAFPNAGFRKSDDVSLPHFFLNLRFNGAWDTTLSLNAPDPRELHRRGFEDKKDYFYIYGIDDLKRVGDTYFAPPAHALAPYFQDIAFINGVHMIPNNIIHEVNREYMVSGSITAGDPAFAFQLSEALARKSGQRPRGVLHQYEYETVQTGAFRNHRSMISLLSVKEEADQGVTPGDIFDCIGNEDCDGQDSTDPYKRVAEVEKVDRQVYEAYKRFQKMMGDPIEEPFNYLLLCLAGFTTGFYQLGILDFVKDQRLDTHGSRHVKEHPENLTIGFSNLAKVIELLKRATFTPAGHTREVSLFECTTVVVTSEFARTVANDGSDGTDHNPKNNSCLLFGKGVRGGQILGESHIWSPKHTARKQAELRALPFDFQTGRALPLDVLYRVIRDKIDLKDLPGGKTGFIFPENIWMTVAEIFGLPQGTSHVEKALKLESIIKG